MANKQTTPTASNTQVATTKAARTKPKLAVRYAQQVTNNKTAPASAQAILAAWVAAGQPAPVICTGDQTGLIMLQINGSPVQHYFINASGQLMFNHTYSPRTGKTFAGLRHTLWAYRMLTTVTKLPA